MPSITSRLLFVHIEDLSGFSPFSINFSNDHDITFAEGTLEISRKINTFRSVLGPNITDINIIAGENGIGKTTLLRTLAAILSAPDHDDIGEEHDFLLIHEVAPGKLKLFNSLSIGPTRIAVYDNELAIVDADEYSTPEKPIIYYSPFLDFNLLDVGTRNKKIPVIDISQTYTLLKDLDEDQGAIAGEVGVFHHKTKNVVRQLRLVRTVNSVHIPFDTPQYIDIRFNRLLIEKDDIPVMGRSLFEHLQLICAYYLRGYPQNNMSRKEIAKLIFLRNLLTLYFLSVNSDKSSEALQSNYPGALQARILDLKEGFEHQEVIEVMVRFFKEEGHFKTSFYTNFIKQVFDHIDRNDQSMTILDRKTVLNLRVPVGAKVVDQLLQSIKMGPSDDHYHEFTAMNIQKFIFMEWTNLSSGEKAFLDIFSRLHELRAQLPATSDTIMIFLDEGEVGFHPSWQMRYIWTLKEYLMTNFREHNFQLLLATHSPLVLSDLPSERVHLFRRASDRDKTLRVKVDTFGTLAQNVNTLLVQDFFVQDTLIGRMAREYIDHILLNISNITEGDTEVDPVDIENEIQAIDEPVIRKLLLNQLNRVSNA